MIEPSGTTPPPFGAVTVAVNVTLWPNGDGLRLDTRPVAVASFTVWIRGKAELSVDVAAKWVASPLYDAVMVCFPTVSAGVAKVAVAVMPGAFRATFAFRLVAPSKK